jgi:quercetin dioxygenase-like cupin family protein
MSEELPLDSLRKIFESKHFRNAVTQRKLLEHLLSVGSQGPHPVSQASIARAVFGGNQVGQVGVNIARLRARLERYYEDEGSTERIRLRIPSRSYRVVVEPASIATARRLRAGGQQEIPVHEFRELVDDLTALQDPKERNGKTRTWIESSARFSRLFDDPANPLPSGNEFTAFLDFVVNQKMRLSITEMQSFAKTFGIHPILVDPLGSKPSSKHCLVLHLVGKGDEPPGVSADLGRCEVGEFIAPGGQTGSSGDKEYGARVHYHIPSHRLQGANPAFIDLILEPGGRSDSHRHGGDELAFLLRGGPVEIRLHDGGEIFRLDQGDYVHFYAEQSHSAHNVSDKDAELFVVRFYQHRRPHLRTDPASREEIQEEVRALCHGRAEQLSNASAFARAWMLEVGGRFPRRAEWVRPGKRDLPDQVLNGLGLARFLMRFVGTSTLRSDRRRTLEQLSLGTSAITLAELPRLGAEFGVEYKPLLYEFLFPGVPQSVFVPRHVDAETGGWVDLEDVGDVVSAGVKHEIPKRSLACSDIAVAWLTLEPGKVTQSAAHPGSELLVPVAGEATIEMKDDASYKTWEKVCQVSAPNHLCYFRSMLTHRVCNYTDQPVAMLLVRFYSDGSAERPAS